MDYDVIVLGAGTAGSNTAKTAVKMGVVELSLMQWQSNKLLPA